MGKVKIIPAALGESEDEVRQQLNKISILSREIHTDYADGLLVSGKTIDFQYLLELPNLYPNNDFELHIMAQNPLPTAFQAQKAGYENIVLAVEGLNIANIDELEELGEQVNLSLALSPNSKSEIIKPYLNVINGITIMTVEPGGQGRSFQPSALKKIKEITEMGFGGIFEVDGGVNLATINDVVKAGACRLVVGSALTLSAQPRKIYSKLLSEVNKRS